LSGYKGKDRDNEAGSGKYNETSSGTETIRIKPKCRKYGTKYLYFGFRNIDVDG